MAPTNLNDVNNVRLIQSITSVHDLKTLNELHLQHIHHPAKLMETYPLKIGRLQATLGSLDKELTRLISSLKLDRK